MTCFLDIQAGKRRYKHGFYDISFSNARSWKVCIIGEKLLRFMATYVLTTMQHIPGTEMTEPLRPGANAQESTSETSHSYEAARRPRNVQQ
ncbi:hypothetical protein M514_26158 [Trichuris suis]|uniref:Uncharacterized protein n=1 Tax=Trichuris suis TaxID=68888 RepID=A0A085MWP3_9BILA|nr:hypothetical protein M514_26158 [Trichuris suis]